MLKVSPVEITVNVLRDGERNVVNLSSCGTLVRATTYASVDKCIVEFMWLIGRLRGYADFEIGIDANVNQHFPATGSYEVTAYLLIAP